MKELESRIIAGVARNDDTRAFLRDPTGDALTHPDSDSPNEFGMRVLGCTKYQLVLAVGKEIQQAGISSGDFNNNLDDMLEYSFEVEGIADRIRNSVQDVDLASLFSQGLLKLRGRGCTFRHLSYFFCFRVRLTRRTLLRDPFGPAL